MVNKMKIEVKTKNGNIQMTSALSLTAVSRMSYTLLASETTEHASDLLFSSQITIMCHDDSPRGHP